jgi:hypothetical protein
MIFFFSSVVESDLTRSSVNGSPPNKAQVAPLTRDTNLIEDGSLAYEVLVTIDILTILKSVQ